MISQIYKYVLNRKDNYVMLKSFQLRDQNLLFIFNYIILCTRVSRIGISKFRLGVSFMAAWKLPDHSSSLFVEVEVLHADFSVPRLCVP